MDVEDTTRVKDAFKELKLNIEGEMKFIDNNKGKIIWIGEISNNFTSIENVLLVDLKYSLLSISQLYEKGHRVILEFEYFFFIDIKDNLTKVVGHRHDNVYVIYLDDLTTSLETCLVALNNDCLLWHRRLAHINMDQS